MSCLNTGHYSLLNANGLKSWKTRSLVHRCSERAQSVFIFDEVLKASVVLLVVKETTEYSKLLGLISCIFITGCIFSASVNIHD